MEHVEAEPMLTDLSTHWTVVFEAHSGKPGKIDMAVSELMCRYAGAVHRYLLKAVKIPRPPRSWTRIRGPVSARQFSPCRPQAGPFSRLREASRPESDQRLLPAQRSDRSRNTASGEPIFEHDGPAHFEQQFLESWRIDLLDRAWNSLAALETTTGQPYHTVLRFRVDHPALTSGQLAEQLTVTLARPLTPGAVRQALQRSRRKYVDFLLAVVLASLSCPTQDDLEEELSDLNLLNYCRPFAKRRPDP